ncbi:hypothetical protein BH10BAC4_BH10BAC4_17940 [soil metagenome]
MCLLAYLLISFIFYKAMKVNNKDMNQVDKSEKPDNQIQESRVPPDTDQPSDKGV